MIAEEEKRKYKTSNLNELQQQSLADAIARVMDETDGYCDSEFSLENPPCFSASIQTVF